MSGNSNSDKMTLEAKLVLVIENHAIKEFISDPDAIEALAKQAIQNLLDKQIKNTDSYGRISINTDSPVAIAARKAADDICERLVEKFINDEAVQAKIQDTIWQLMPLVIMQRMENQAHISVQSMMFKTTEHVVNQLRAINKIS